MDGCTHFYPKFHPSHWPCHIQYNFFCFNGEPLEDPSLELQMSKHHSTLGMHLLTLRTARYEGITPHLHFLPTYLPRTPTYSPRYYQGSMRFWHPLETQTPTIIALYPIQHPCWVESNKDFKSPFLTNSFPNSWLHFGSSFFPHTRSHHVHFFFLQQ